MSTELAQLMKDNLEQVWNERDPVARLEAIKRMYTVDAILYDPGEPVTGHEQINNSVTTVQQNLPPAFRFRLLKPAVMNHNLGKASWGVGPEGQPEVSTGMDIAIFENGKIRALYVFLEG
jgi:hypothetical protein